MDIWGFMRDAVAGFVGAGLALLTLGTLGKSLVDHWLSKAITRYAARVETDELRKRVAIERLDKERSEFVRALHANTVQVHAKMLRGIHPDEVAKSRAAGGGSETLHLNHWKGLCDMIDRISIDIASATHLFPHSDPLLVLAGEWCVHTRERLDRYWDAVAVKTDVDEHWLQSPDARAEQMETIRVTSLVQSADYTKMSELVALSRAYTQLSV